MTVVNLQTQSGHDLALLVRISLLQLMTVHLLMVKDSAARSSLLRFHTYKHIYHTDFKPSLG